MLSNLHTRLVGSTRIPSFAGQGLPERMRSTVFAFMGLTAAAGLALVAIFAQIGFPLLAPAPMPSDPSQANAVAGAEVVRLDPRPQASHPAQQAGGDSLAGRSDAARGGAPASGERGSNAASPGGSPQPGGSAGGDSPSGAGGAPAPPAAPATPPTPPPTPAPAPAPEPATPSPPPQPEVPVAPAPAPALPPAAAVSEAPPAHSSAGGNGNGKALGLYK